MALSRGIDVSHWQGSVNWATLRREHGLTWGACKATESAVDSRFAANWAGMKANGLVRMAYHFARPEQSSAATQAAFFASVVKPQPGDVLCLDLEKSQLSQASTNAWALAFGRYLRARYPLNVLVAYLGGYSQNDSGKGAAAVFDYWWYPRYATMSPVSAWPKVFNPRLSGNTTGWKAPHIWQWACSLKTSEGQVDANVSPLTATQLRTRPGTSPVVHEEDPLAGFTLDQIAQAVVDKKVNRPDNTPDRLGDQVGAANVNAFRALQVAKANGAQLAALTAAVQALAASQGLDSNAIIAAVTEQVQTALTGFVDGYELDIKPKEA